MADQGVTAPAGGARVTMEMPTAVWERCTRDRLIAGDDGALGECYDQFASFVYGLVLRVVRDTRAAEDISQDVFLGLWENPSAFDPDKGALRTWLGTLAHRRAVDYVRREEARRRRDEVVLSRISSPPDVEEMALALMTAERVRDALESLPPEQHEAIRLAYFEGKTYREVAIAMNIPEGTAKSRLRLALRRVAGTLESEDLRQWA
jgi:RNA polymerase sigma-70 factor (ECF subfamily)